MFMLSRHENEAFSPRQLLLEASFVFFFYSTLGYLRERNMQSRFFFRDASKISFPSGNYHVTFNEDDNVVRLIN